MKVASVMTKDVGACLQSETLDQAAQIMVERDCGVVPVVDRRGSWKLAGVVTDRDICIAAYTTGHMLGQISIGEVMAKDVVCCRASDEVDAAEQMMKQAQVHRLPVVDESDRLVGMLSIADLARAASRRAQTGVTALEVGETLAAIRRPRFLESRAT